MKTNEEINERILTLWENHSTESGENSPLLYPEFIQNGILFIGLNPSKSRKAFDTIFKDNEYKKIGFKEFFKKENINKYYPEFKKTLKEIHIEGEELAKRKYSYFKKFRDNWKEFNHIDLFVYRLTNQKEFKSKIGLDKNKKGDIINNNFKEFGREQLKLASDLIQLLKPKTIVVANAFASDIIDKYSDIFKINKKHFNEKGYDTIKIGNDEVPILFTSMLTQQRALDNHTFRRLKWQINKILEDSV
ncbi:MAG: hypothetical protein ABIH65_03625 [Nanoarchaeota archaeon]